jgi:hypothetical protein
MTVRITRNSNASTNNNYVTMLDLTKTPSTQPCCSNQTSSKQPTKS